MFSAFRYCRYTLTLLLVVDLHIVTIFLACYDAWNEIHNFRASPRFRTVENWSLVDSRIISVLVARVTNWPHRWIRNRDNALGLHRLLIHLRLDTKITSSNYHVSTLIYRYYSYVFWLEIVIVSIIDIYVDCNKMAVEAVKVTNIFLFCWNMWLFQRYNSRKQQLDCFYNIL